MPFSPDEARQKLTPRELEIVSAVVAGYTNKEISENLKLTQHTVKNYLCRIFDKLGVASRLQLALVWLGGDYAFPARCCSPPDGPKEDGHEAGIAVKKPKGPHSDSGSAAASLDE